MEGEISKSQIRIFIWFSGWTIKGIDSVICQKECLWARFYLLTEPFKFYVTDISQLSTSKYFVMADQEKIDAYIEKQESWKKELTTLRSIFLQTEMTETVKWGMPTYQVNGKNVAGFSGFKEHYGIWFFQGVFLKDAAKKLMNAQEGKTHAMRQWRFVKGDKIDKKLVLSYLKEALQNQKDGKVAKVQKGKKVPMPPELEARLKKDKKLKTHFDKMRPSQQKEFFEYISEAKREATKESRLDKITPMILGGVGLHDKYK